MTATPTGSSSLIPFTVPSLSQTPAMQNSPALYVVGGDGVSYGDLPLSSGVVNWPELFRRTKLSSIIRGGGDGYAS